MHGKKRIYELAKEMNKASKDVVDKAHQLGMDVKNHMGAISSEQETKLRQAFGGGSTVNTQSKATNNQKQQTTQNKPANKKPMNNKPGEQRNNQNRPKTNQRMDNKETTTTKIVTAKATHKTVAIKQIQTIKTAIPKTITVLQRIKIGPAKITMAGTTKIVAAKTVTTILVAVKIVITGITLITKTAIVSTKKEKRQTSTRISEASSTST